MTRSRSTQIVEDAPAHARTESAVLRDLIEDVRRLRWSGVAITGAAAAAVVLLVAGGGDAPTTIAAGIGTVATLLSLIVALAIFSWTRRKNDGQDQRLSDIYGLLESAGPKLLPDDTFSEQDGTEEPQPYSVVEQTFTIDGRSYEVLTDPLHLNGEWWLWMLGRINKVLDDDRYKFAAQELMKTPLADIKAIATLADRRRGNRRTLLIAETPSGPRVWSVFAGNGSHVIDVTSQVQLGTDNGQ